MMNNCHQFGEKTIVPQENTMRLSAFIREHLEPILQAWEDFARTIEPPALTMDAKALRNHASHMLIVIAADLDSPQSPYQQSEKSKGHGTRSADDTAAETHAVARMLSGFSIEQVASEYRALRASVLRLWAAESKKGLRTDLDDVTRFNEAIDQALAESIARYAKLVKQAQNLFLAILGHDLHNPLGATITGANVMMLATDIDSRYRDIATRIFESGQRMSKLVDDLIDYTRTHLGRGLPIAPKQTNIAHICENVINEMRTFHPERTIEFDAARKLEGIWDEDRIAQVISNLIGNALQHGSQSEPVVLKMHSDVNDVVVTINNRGPAIPQKKLQPIFEPLVRFARNETGDYDDGTSLGIGLYIAREIVIAHGGAISVHSSEGDGTTFTVRLPRIPSLDS